MAKMTIYVPDDLKRRMDEAEGVNWSPLACSAFEAKLAEIITQKGTKGMQDVITRLKASKVRAASESRKAGYGAGVAWAENKAEAAELERLEKLANEPQWGLGIIFNDPTSAYGPGERLFAAICDPAEMDREDAAVFWEDVAGADVDINQDFLEGFAEGAIEIWDAVKDQL